MYAMAMVPRLGAKTPVGFSPVGQLGSGHLGRDPSHKDRLEWPGDPRRGDKGGQPASSLPTPGATGERSSEMGSPRPTQGPEESVTPGRHQQQSQGTVQGALLPPRPLSTLLTPGGWGREIR